MIELSVFAAAVLVLGTIAFPRTTFAVTWFFNTAAVSTILGGSALVFSIVGFFFVPRIMFTYFLLEAASGAPASTEIIYWLYLALAAFIDVTTTMAATNNTSSD
jgi:hypothetical protein